MARLERERKEAEERKEEGIADAIIQNKSFQPVSNNQNGLTPSPHRIAERPGQEEDDGEQNPQGPGTALNTERNLISNDEPMFL